MAAAGAIVTVINEIVTPRFGSVSELVIKRLQHVTYASTIGQRHPDRLPWNHCTRQCFFLYAYYREDP